jgi:GGDEF domain-containing protein
VSFEMTDPPNEGAQHMIDVVTPLSTDDVLTTPDAVRRQHQSLFDHATALPGWPLLIDRTGMALARAARTGGTVAVVVLDDVRRRSAVSPDFTTCVAILRDSVRADETVARIGGRTFVLVLDDVVDAGAVTERVRDIVDGLDIHCQVGIALASRACDPEALVNRARQDALPPPPAPAAPGWEEQYLLGAGAV